MNKNNKKRQCRDLEKKWYLGCGINPKDTLSHNYLNGNIPDLLVVIRWASVKIQDGSNSANLKKKPKQTSSGSSSTG